MGKIKHHLPWLAWLIIILVLCLTPGDQLPQVEWQLISIGTFAHFILYFGLSGLMLFGFLNAKASPEEKKLNTSNSWLYLSVVLTGILIGYGIELIQENAINQRFYDLEDIIVNSIGMILGAIGYTLIGRKIV